MRPTRSLFLIALNARSAATSAATRAFGARCVPEALARREVDDEHHGHLALFDEDLHEGVVHARGDVPVDRADVVAGLVRAHLAEREALALEDGLVRARELLVGEPRRVDLDGPQRCEELPGNHAATEPSDHGTSTTSKTRRTTCSRRDLLGLGLVGEDDAVAQHVGADGLHVLGRDVAAVAEERVRARREVERDRGARARAELDERREVLQAVLRPARASRTRRRRCSP